LQETLLGNGVNEYKPIERNEHGAGAKEQHVSGIAQDGRDGFPFAADSKQPTP